MNSLVLGGKGFIGKKLVDKLLEEDGNIDILSRKKSYPTDIVENKLNYVKADLLDKGCDFRSIFRKYDVIFNCSGELKDESLMYPLHVESTKRMVEACKAVAKKQNRCIHWVQLSSVGAYGPPLPRASTERVVTEDTEPHPVGTYEVTKTLADEMIEHSADEYFTYTILRPANVFGAAMPNNSIRQMAMMIQKGLFFYIGKQGAISNYVHVDDVVDALMLCGFDKRARTQIYNLSNDCPQEFVINALADYLAANKPRLRLNEGFVKQINFLFGWIPGFPLKESRIDALVGRTRYSVKKIEAELGFKPARDVCKTISEVIK